MPTINTHLGENINWNGSKNAHNNFNIAFLNSNVAYDISSLTFTLIIRKRKSSAALLTLTEGSGLTNGGAAGTLAIVLTQTQASTTLSGEDFFWELKYTSGGFTRNAFQGGLRLVSDSNPESTTTTLSATVNLSGTSLTANLTLNSAFENSNIDGGSASTTYLADQNINGGNA